MNAPISLEALGFTKEELQQRVVDQLCQQLLTGISADDDGEEYTVPSALQKKLEAQITKQIDLAIATLAEKHVLPNVTSYLENLCLQETNKWGEKTGQKLTFIEFLVARTEAYMAEEVNYEGKSRAENSFGSWEKRSTRIAYLVNRHLHYHLEAAMKRSLEQANSAIAAGLEQATKVAIENVLKTLAVKATISTP